MRTKFFIPFILFLFGYVEASAQFDSQFYETFPQHNGKYRLLANTRSDYASGQPSTPLSWIDSTAYTYKNNTTNALDSIFEYSKAASDPNFNAGQFSGIVYDTTQAYTQIVITGNQESTNVPSGRYTERRNKQGFIVLNQEAYWNNDSLKFINGNKDEYQYDNLNRLTKDKYFLWMNNAWSPVVLTEYDYYDNTINIKTVSVFMYDPMDSTIILPNRKTEYTYNAQNNIVRIEHFVAFNTGEGSVFNKDFLEEYIYTNGTRLDSMTRHQYYVQTDGVTIDSFLNRTVSLTYDVNNQLEKQVIRVGYTETSPFIPWQQLFHTYADGNLATTTIQYWSESDNDWVDNEEYTYTYNDGGYGVKETIKIWLVSAQEWRKHREKDYFYEKNDNGYIDVYEEPTPGTSNLSIADQQFVNVELFPNPTHDVLTVKVEENASYQIVSLSGEKLQSGQLNAGTDNKITLGSIPAGHYMFVVNDGKTYHFVKLGN